MTPRQARIHALVYLGDICAAMIDCPDLYEGVKGATARQEVERQAKEIVQMMRRSSNLLSLREQRAQRSGVKRT